MKNKLTNKKLILIFSALAVLCIAALAAFRFMPSADKKIAVISKDGTVIQRIDLSAVVSPYTVNVGGNVILIENGSVSMQSADCPDKLCVRQGAIHNGTRPIVCLPNRVTVSIESESDTSVPDAVVGRIGG